MKKNLLSIIVPVYNVEKFLPKCVDSLLNQTYKNIEIILVDDGSTDESGIICDNYKLKDNRIKVIHKENGGLSSARNVGMEYSKGNFLGFVDSDDFVDEKMFEIMMNNMIREDADISSCGSYHVYSENNIVNLKKENIYLSIHDISKAIDLMYSFGYYGTGVWDKIYKKELWNNITFPIGKKSEDMFVLYKVFDRANTVVYDSTPLYYYVQHKKSITHDKKDINIDSIEATENIIEFLNNKYSSIAGSGYRIYAFALIGVYDKCLVSEKYEMLKVYKKKFNNIYFKIDKSNIPFLRLMQLFLLYYFPIIYNLLFKIYYKKKGF